jgi:sarcosine dehydrogenase
MQSEAAVVIIGGGIFGCSIAYHLAKQGQRDVVVLERNAIASGTTPMAAGLVPQVRATELLTRALTYSLELFENFERETGCSAGFHQVGSVKLALDDARIQEMEDNIALGRKLGIAIDFITPAQAQALVPILHLDGVKAMTFAPRDGFVNPHLTAVGLATAAHRLGVTVRTHTRVTGLTLGSHGEHLVHTAAGAIRTPVVVDAAGAWARALGQGVGLHVPVTPIRHQYAITAPLPGVRATQPVLRFPGCVPAFTRGVTGHKIGLVLGRELRPLVHDHP